MKSNSTTITYARVARRVGEHGRVSELELEEILRENGIYQGTAAAKRNLVTWRYLYYDPVEHKYRITSEGEDTCTISITVPFLNSKEIRRHLVQTYSGYPGVIEIGEVEG